MKGKLIVTVLASQFFTMCLSQVTRTEKKNKKELHNMFVHGAN